MPSVRSTGRLSRTTRAVPAPRRPGWARSADTPGSSTSRAAATPHATRWTQYPPSVPTAVIAAAPTNGPTNEPIRLTPPSVDSALARSSYGTASVTYVCRATPHTAPAKPIPATPAASTHTRVARTQVSSAGAISPAAHSIARRSP